jgi:hypothetical protein
MIVGKAPVGYEIDRIDVVARLGARIANKFRSAPRHAAVLRGD